MPEGDTLYSAAATLRKAIHGKRVTEFKSKLAGIQDAADHASVVGRRISAVEARGKHMLITFARPHTPAETANPHDCSGQIANPHDPRAADLVLHTHLRMTGSWHLYRPGERWQKADKLAVVTIFTEDFVAPCFSAPVVELLTARQMERHPELAALGPDAMTERFDAEEAKRRMLRRPDAEIAVALLNQRLMAGVGNVFKSEVLFICRVSPFLKVVELPEETIDRLIEESHRLLRLNEGGGARRTRFGLNDRQKLWVYGRSGEPCYACGEKVRMRRQGLDARSTYYCPRCQGASG